jgi:DNA helicase-2/ATP-dependent DNA helicase PcrA
MWQADRSPEAPGRLENLKELVTAMGEFGNLGGFLEHVGLVMDNAADSAGDMVNLMTLHSAKGLEFDTVFLPGWEQGLFPSQRAIEETGLAGLEEERRLAYVGLTRARLRAYIGFAGNRRIHGQWQSTLRSQFVDELPREHIEFTAAPGLNPTASRAASSSWGPIASGQGSGWPLPAKAQRAPTIGPSLIAGVARRHRELRQQVAKVGGFNVGDRVFNQKFGYGTVRAVDDKNLSVSFDLAGDKKVMDAFVEHV